MLGNAQEGDAVRAGRVCVGPEQKEAAGALDAVVLCAGDGDGAAAVGRPLQRVRMRPLRQRKARGAAGSSARSASPARSRRLHGRRVSGAPAARRAAALDGARLGKCCCCARPTARDPRRVGERCVSWLGGWLTDVWSGSAQPTLHPPK